MSILEKTEKHGVNKMDFKEIIPDFISSRVEESFSSKVCENCSSSCCRGPGFALLENIELIYQEYQKGNLIRKDYSFLPDLTFCAFIDTYFDKVVFHNTLITFFPKTLRNDNTLITTPPWQYYEARDYLHSIEGKNGCIFLEQKYSPESISNKCILHSPDNDIISKKPIDCSFLTCSLDRIVKRPKSIESNFWLSLLDISFPDSLLRYKNLCQTN